MQDAVQQPGSLFGDLAPWPCNRQLGLKYRPFEQKESLLGLYLV